MAGRIYAMGERAKDDFDAMREAHRRHSEDLARGPGPAIPYRGPIFTTVCIPVGDIDDGDYVDLANFTLPTGRMIYVVAAVISDNAGNADSGYDMTVYNVTDSATIYETSSATLQMGTIHAPLNTTEVAEADQVRITAANNSGSDAWLCGLVTFAVL